MHFSQFLSFSLASVPYPKFIGNRKNLDELLACAQPIVKHLPTDGCNLAEIFSDDILLVIASVLPLAQCSWFGKCLADLPPTRFDALCDEINARLCESQLQPIALGYPHKDSKWQAHFLAGKKEAGGVYPKAATLEREMAMCCNGDFYGRLKLYENPKELSLISSISPCRFELNKQIYSKLVVDWVRIRKPELEWIQAFIPAIIDLPDWLTKEQFQEIRGKLTNTVLPYYQVKFTSDQDEMVELTRQANKEAVWLSLSGYDPMSFNGEWPIPDEWKHRLENTLLHNLIHGYPSPFLHSLILYIFSCDLPQLRASLHFVEKGSIPEIFFHWLPYSSPVCIRNFKTLLQELRPYLEGKEAPILTDLILRQNLHPLFAEILKNPNDYWPALVDYAQRNDIDNSEEEWLDFDRQSNAPKFNLVCLAISQGWKKLFAQTYPNCDARLPCTVHLLNLLIETNLLTDSYLMVISANMPLLATMLKARTAEQLLNLIGHPKIVNRLKLMLHLQPSTPAFDEQGQPIKKSEPKFRNWVLHKLPCRGHRVADLKLLDYYFRNLIFGGYDGFDFTRLDSNGVQWMLGVIRLDTPINEKALRLEIFFDFELEGRDVSSLAKCLDSKLSLSG